MPFTFLFLEEYLDFLECPSNLVRAGYKSDDCEQKTVVWLKSDNQRLSQRQAMKNVSWRRSNLGHKEEMMSSARRWWWWGKVKRGNTKSTISPVWVSTLQRNATSPIMCFTVFDAPAQSPVTHSLRNSVKTPHPLPIQTLLSWNIIQHQFDWQIMLALMFF